MQQAEFVQNVENMKGGKPMEGKILAVGDSAVSVQLGSEISLDVNQKVRKLFINLTEKPLDGVVEMVPTYAALMIHYRPDKILFRQMKEEIEERLRKLEDSQQTVQEGGRIVKEIPICYDRDLALDLEACAEFEHISVEEFIRIHSGHEYYCYMLGVAPGHPYMARFDEPFHFKRRENPRVRISGGSVVAQLNQSNLIPFDQPCGWNIVGATPLTICDYKKEDPFLVHAGDWIKYVPVDRKEYDRIKEEDQKGTYRVKTYEKRAV